jgi:hypothetical protein
MRNCSKSAIKFEKVFNDKSGVENIKDNYY